jgi:hypothetical protein
MRCSMYLPIWRINNCFSATFITSPRLRLPMLRR